ncbi:MAG TPA: hypothetical protein VMW27_30610 [Thermoanaerobaculia bacterium]|nr:hypothetical protein [Thermoanaerobaculia bacterium]
MKKKSVRKLNLSRETLQHLTIAGGGEDFGVVKGDGVALSIPVCTQVISDCLYCTTPLNSCPKTFQTCTCA